MQIIRVFAYLIIFTIFYPSLSFPSFVGPYSGTILDSINNEPIEGVSVFVVCTKYVSGFDNYRTVLADAKFVETDQKGEYRIPRKFVSTFQGGLEDINLIIYQPGYQTITARRWFRGYHGEDPPLSFENKNVVIKLDRIPPNFNHKVHFKKITEALRNVADYTSMGEKYMISVTGRIGGEDCHVLNTAIEEKMRHHSVMPYLRN